MKTSLIKMLKDKSGNFGMMMALLSIPLIGTVGVSIDYVTAYNRQTELQVIADNAVLMAASSRLTDDAKLTALAKKNFDAQINGSDKNARILDLKIDQSKYVTIKVETIVPVTLTALFRPNGIRIEALSQAVIGSDDNVEVAMVLDNTYSMVGQKLTDLKTASNALLDVFQLQMTGAADQSKVRFAIVPFSRYVNVGLTNRTQTWLSVASDTSTTTNVCSTSKPVISQSGCTSKLVTAYNDGVPYTYTSTSCASTVYGPAVTTCKNQTSTTKWNGCVGSRANPWDTKDDEAIARKYTGMMNVSCGAAITQLTSNYTTLRAQIKAMVANDETFISTGMLWGLNMLSPEAPFTDGRAYSDDNKKFVILMTDGDNTVSPTYPAHTGTDKVKSDKLMLDTCATMKGKGVVVYTIAVGVTVQSTLDKLASCATDPSKAISVKDTSTLTTVFTNVAKQILAVRLTR